MVVVVRVDGELGELSACIEYRGWYILLGVVSREFDDWDDD